ncbi:prostatic acid phosphatase-like [Patiria miniata]|uniref:acid phosphatase n=1 Tax=Patiria miniata TaxID=46514 RepID=A0A914B8L5_PATMI|nr:prostatic acid phosphatase-like [Patiria miniata]
MHRFFLIFIVLLCRGGFHSFAGLVNGQRTLQLVNLLYRHGDRTPVNIYPTDPHQADTWPEGLGQLTTLGMNMHYNLGQWLRKRYIDSGFMNATYNRLSLHVRSTDKDRTLMSAESDLAGLYPPQGNQKWKAGFDWMPIPVHTVPLDEDYLLEANGPPCPVYDELKEQIKDEAEYKELEAQYKDFMANLTINTGFKTPVTVNNIYKIEDPLFVERQHNLSWPAWTNVPGFYTTLKFLSDKGMYFLFNSKEKSRLKGGPLVGQIIDNMVNKSTTTDPDDLRRRVYMYSAHDTTVAAFQSALGVYNGLQPPLASCVGIEMWKEVSGEYTVNMWYHNDTTKDVPYPLLLDNCNRSSCPLDDFIKVTKDIVPDDIKQECGVAAPVGLNSTLIIILVSIVIGLLAIIIIALAGLVVCRCRSNRTKDGHIRLPTDDTTA